VTSRAEMTTVLTAITAAAGLVLLAASRPRAMLHGQGGSLSGSLQHTPAAAALALVALAGAGALILVRGWARTLIATLLVLVAAGVVATMATLPADYGWFNYSGIPPTVTRSAWAWIGMGAGGLLGVAAAVAAVRARRWPQPRLRYESRGPRRPDPGADPWDALDRGEDPTR
jgi:hypothetical protein